MTEAEQLAGINADYEQRYGFHDAEHYLYKAPKGLNREIVEKISAQSSSPNRGECASSASRRSPTSWPANSPPGAPRCWPSSTTTTSEVSPPPPDPKPAEAATQPLFPPPTDPRPRHPATSLPTRPPASDDQSGQESPARLRWPLRDRQSSSRSRGTTRGSLKVTDGASRTTADHDSSRRDLVSRLRLSGDSCCSGFHLADAPDPRNR